MAKKVDDGGRLILADWTPQIPVDVFHMLQEFFVREKLFLGTQGTTYDSTKGRGLFMSHRVFVSFKGRDSANWADEVPAWIYKKWFIFNYFFYQFFPFLSYRIP